MNGQRCGTVQLTLEQCEGLRVLTLSPVKNPTITCSSPAITIFPPNPWIQPTGCNAVVSTIVKHPHVSG